MKIDEIKNLGIKNDESVRGIKKIKKKNNKL